MTENLNLDFINSEPPTHNRNSSPAVLLIVLATCLLVLLPIIYYGCDGETDRWRAARVMENYLSGDRTNSIKQMEKLVGANPRDLQMRLTLARWLLDDAQTDRALELATQIHEIAPNNPIVQSLYHSCLLASGEFAGALEQYKKDNLEVAGRSYGDLLAHKNSLAYFRSLSASDESDLALDDITFVVNELDKQWSRKDGFPMNARQQAALCSAIAYHYYCHEIGDDHIDAVGIANDNSETQTISHFALNNLSREISRQKRVYQEVLNLAKRETSEMMAKGVPLDRDDNQKLVGRRGQLEKMGVNLCALLCVRAQFSQLIGDDQRSFRDRLLVEQLGFDPEQIVKRFPDIDFCGSHLQLLAQILDTRGCVYYQQKSYLEALLDLNAAITAQEALALVAADLPIANLELTTDPRQRRENFMRQPKKVLAVLLYHRSWVNRALGRSKSALNDTRRIRQLGYTPGTHLF